MKLCPRPCPHCRQFLAEHVTALWLLFREVVGHHEHARHLSHMGRLDQWSRRQEPLG